MLNITSNPTETALELTLEGRLDTVTAPQLQNTIDEYLGDAPDLVLDCKDLTYISSAGLRVLLMARKTILGELTLKNVDPSVREVLEITGFVDILTIE